MQVALTFYQITLVCESIELNQAPHIADGLKFAEEYQDSKAPQGSMLGPLLFNIFINDIFFFIEKSEICNFADDNTVY